MNESQFFADALMFASPAERAAYLDEACAGNPEARAAVEALLRAHDRDPGFLEQPAGSLGGTVDVPADPRPEDYARRFPELGPGRLVDAIVPVGSPATVAPTDRAAPAGVRYRRLREHAKGGLGEVFVAHDEELSREVALKEIQDRFADHPDARARFLREAEVTGKLEHPGVVPVYGMGAYPDGRPFYAMRFIRGESMQAAIRRFHQADEDPRRDPGERSLALRELLGRFVAVCNAVAYAHSKGVLHRDLKGANVMLGEYGETLVVDWGLARLLDQPDGEQKAERPVRLGLGGGTAPTEMGQVVGTPAFMPPEQAHGRLDQMGPRSDVFALGATLYCLLTGNAPYGGADALVQAAMAEVVPARQRKRSVPAALESVCVKAMAAKPEDRYGTAKALAEEVQRWLADEPVLAYREPWTARAGRWLRRHQTLASTTAAALLVALVLGGFGAWRLERQAAQQRQAVESALQEVARLQQQARWAEARVALDGAESRLGEGGAEYLRVRLEQARRDLDLVTLLDDIRLKRATVVDGRFDTAGADRRYEEAFRKAEMGEVGGDAVLAAAWVGDSAVRESLVAALDDWALCARKRERRDWLLEVARRADPDPWRDLVRDPAVWDDRTALARLVNGKAVAEQSPQLLVALAWRLTDLGGDAEGLLRTAQDRHPEDFWVNFTLGRALAQGKKSEEAVGFYRAALALRPGTVGVHNNLGNALRDKGKVDEAIAEYRKAIDLDPKFGSAHYNLGIALREKGKVDEAIAEYRKAIDLDPKHAIAHNNLGAALREKGKVDEAISEYRKAIDLDPKNAPAHDNLGAALREKGKVEEAIAEFRKAIDLDPKLAKAHRNLGIALRDKGKVDEAISEYRKAIDLDPKHAPAHDNLGAALREKGKVEEAIAEFRKAIDLDPKLAKAHRNLGAALREKGKVDEAISEYRKAIDLDPKNAPAHDNLGAALREKGKVEEAIAEFRKAIDLDPKHAGTHYNLGNALKAKGKVDEAIAEYRKAIDLDPKFALAHNNLGRALYAKGKVDEAISEYRKAIQLDPKEANAHNNLGNALRAKGKVDEAISEYRKAIDLDPKHAPAHDNLGIALRARGKVDEAIAEYRKAIDLDPKHAGTHYNLGNALYAKGKLDEAIAEYRKAIDLDPKNAMAHRNLGVALNGKGKVEEAITEYRKAIELDPRFAEAHCNLGGVLGKQGRLTESLEALRRGHALGSKRPGWPYPSALWVRQAERLVQQEKELLDVLSGKRKPANAVERIKHAGLCTLTRRYQAGARLYAEAFTTDAELAGDLKAAHRYHAACAAVLAGCGQGNDAPMPNEKERARLRQQALVWLRADLALWSKQAEIGTPEARAAVLKTLQHWQKDTDLAGVRDAAALEKLPEGERAEWIKLWAEVAAMLKKCNASGKK